jgi:hypothetical protein
MGDVLVSWTLRARHASLTGGAVIGRWTSATLVERCNLPDTLLIEGRTEHLRPLFALDGGCTLSGPTGRRFSGPLSSLSRRKDGTATCSFESDLIRLFERDVYPTPTAAITGQTIDYGDVQSGPAETVILHYVNLNAGPSALTARRVLGLTVPSSLDRGGTLPPVTARLDNLGTLTTDLANSAGLILDVVQNGTSLNVVVGVMADLSGSARYGSPRRGGPGVLGDWSYTINKPDLTRALVAGGGEGTARLFRERADTAAESRWGRRIESIIDQRQTTDTGELDKAGDDAILEGSQPVSIEAEVRSTQGLRLGSDVPIGSLVALDLDGERLVDRLRTITTTIQATSGEPTVKTVGKVGSADGGLTRTQKEFIAMRKSMRKVVNR